MKINKTIYNSVQSEIYKNDKESKKIEESEEETKVDKVELSSYASELKSIDTNIENNPEKSYIQLKYADYKIRENANDALALYDGLSKERVYGLI